MAAAELAVTESQAALDEAMTSFCQDSGAYIEAIDRYGKIFNDDAATVGDVTVAGSDLAEPRAEVESSIDGVLDARSSLADAQVELDAANAALAGADAAAANTTTTTTEPLIPSATVERIQQAEEELEEAANGITPDTPVVEATAEYNAAALALQVAWLQVFDEAGCLTDEQRAEATVAVRDYTTALQTALSLAGYYTEPIDGVYGPSTTAAVEQLQADSGLTVTGWVDRATSEALDAAVAAEVGAVEDMAATQTAAVQTTLKLAGFWTGPVDGVWTEELTAAMAAFQVELGVEPTGVVDAATLSAFQVALDEASAESTTTTAPATTTTADATTTTEETTTTEDG